MTGVKSTVADGNPLTADGKVRAGRVGHPLPAFGSAVDVDRSSQRSAVGREPTLPPLRTGRDPPRPGEPHRDPETPRRPLPRKAVATALAPHGSRRWYPVAGARNSGPRGVRHSFAPAAGRPLLDLPPRIPGSAASPRGSKRRHAEGLRRRGRLGQGTAAARSPAERRRRLSSRTRSRARGQWPPARGGTAAQPPCSVRGG